MPGYLMGTHLDTPTVSSAELAAIIRTTDFSDCGVTVVGYGAMGRQYVKALRALGVKQIRICSRSEGSLAELQGVDGVATLAGGFRRIETEMIPGELGIIATPTADLVAAAEHLAACGYRKILVEKPVALLADEVQRLADRFEKQVIYSACAYNRVAYPSIHEARARTREEGGITSCTYTFTEYVHRIDPKRFPQEEMARWGIANSLHVMSMAHGLIGLPARWSGYRSGAIAWHPSGAVFVGSGISEGGIPFAYHADWGSTGRWSVEVHTAVSSYRLCPLEKLFRRTSATSEWEEVPLVTFSSDVKSGFVEEVAAMLNDDVRRPIPLISLRQASALTRYGEDVFGYT